MRHLALAILGLFLSNAAVAAEPMEIEAWSQPTVGTTGIGIAFATITNNTTEDDILVSASGSASNKVELHTHMMIDDVMRMQKVDSIPVPAGETVELKPGGLHLMMFGMNEQLKAGDDFTLTLTFDNAGKVEVPVRVRPFGHQQVHKHGGHDHSGHGHHSH